VPARRSAEGRPRRSPTDAERRRDPQRTKERILAAAVEEFGEHGYAGARVGRIAERAQVNAQLISYYFDGKAGLYRALSSRWRGVITSVTQPERSMAEIAGDFVQVSGEHRAWGRLLVWEALGDGPTDDPTDDPAGTSQATENPATPHPATEAEERPDPLREQVADLRRRQADGEFPADLDPGHLLVALFAMSSAPTVLPQIVRRILDVEPDSAEFRAAYADQVTRIVRHLASMNEGRLS